jgi:hypothetical protein
MQRCMQHVACNESTIAAAAAYAGLAGSRKTAPCGSLLERMPFDWNHVDATRARQPENAGEDARSCRAEGELNCLAGRGAITAQAGRA